MLKQVVLLTGFIVSITANAALYDRGNGMIYDDVLDITWLQDANYAKTSGYDADGFMTWQDANQWAADLTYGGYSDWRLTSQRLPPNSPTCHSNPNPNECSEGYNVDSGELGHMFYNNLGNIAEKDVDGNFQDGYGLLNISFLDAASGQMKSFSNIVNFFYYYEEESCTDCPWAWSFNFYTGAQYGLRGKTADYTSAWAVRDGDVAATVVPVPAAAWLFGSALVGLAGIKRKK